MYSQYRQQPFPYNHPVPNAMPIMRPGIPKSMYAPPEMYVPAAMLRTSASASSLHSLASVSSTASTANTSASSAGASSAPPQPISSAPGLVGAPPAQRVSAQPGFVAVAHKEAPAGPQASVMDLYRALMLDDSDDEGTAETTQEAKNAESDALDLSDSDEEEEIVLKPGMIGAW